MIVLVAAALAQTPIQVDTQVRLVAATGDPLTGDVTVDVSIHPDGGTSSALWTERMTVTGVSDGYLSLTLGSNTSGNPLYDTVFDGSPRYVQYAHVVGGTPTVLGPRKLIATVPQAVHATNVSGGYIQASADTAACGTSTAGRLRWNQGLQVCDGATWTTLVSETAASCHDLWQRNNTLTDGPYTINPGGTGAFQVYCDFRTDGGWTLLMRIASNTNSHVTNNGVVGTQPCSPTGGVCKVSTDQINRLIAQPGRQVFQIDPDGAYIPWYVATSSDTDEWPTNLESTNRSNLLATSKWTWILTSYQTQSNAENGTAGDVGTYEGAVHYYPTPYSDQQLFFCVNNGIRANTGWSSTGYVENQPGTLWVR